MNKPYLAGLTWSLLATTTFACVSNDNRLELRWRNRQTSHFHGEAFPLKGEIIAQGSTVELLVFEPDPEHEHYLRRAKIADVREVSSTLEVQRPDARASDRADLVVQSSSAGPASFIVDTESGLSETFSLAVEPPHRSVARLYRGWGADSPRPNGLTQIHSAVASTPLVLGHGSSLGIEPLLYDESDEQMVGCLKLPHAVPESMMEFSEFVGACNLAVATRPAVDGAVTIHGAGGIEIPVEVSSAPASAEALRIFVGALHICLFGCDDAVDDDHEVPISDGVATIDLAGTGVVSIYGFDHAGRLLLMEDSAILKGKAEGLHAEPFGPGSVLLMPSAAGEYALTVEYAGLEVTLSIRAR